MIDRLKPASRIALRSSAVFHRAPASACEPDGGFTLIEVLLALTIGGMVVLLAHRAFTGVSDGAQHMAQARVILDHDANAHRWLTEAFGSLDVGNGADFAGRADRVRFTAWQRTAEGWLTRQPVDLGVHGNRLVARLGPADSLVLADSVRHLGLDYLLEPGEGTGAPDEMPGERASFVREWISPVSAPLAVRLRILYATGKADTLLLVIGPRG